jgi:CRP/FNR family cyclic AMP-dependent transcriptional regulator
MPMFSKLSVVQAEFLSGAVVKRRFKKGDCIGEMSLIDNEAHSAGVEAGVQTDVLALGRADGKIGSLALMSAYDRVANVLLQAAQASPHNDMIKPQIAQLL